MLHSDFCELLNTSCSSKHPQSVLRCKPHLLTTAFLYIYINLLLESNQMFHNVASMLEWNINNGMPPAIFQLHSEFGPLWDPLFWAELVGTFCSNFTRSNQHVFEMVLETADWEKNTLLKIHQYFLGKYRQNALRLSFSASEVARVLTVKSNRTAWDPRWWD